jgi:hypothetical protein
LRPEPIHARPRDRQRCLSYIAGLFVCGALACGITAPPCLAQRSSKSAVNVNIITDEAEAVLSVLAKKRAGEAITGDDWQRLFSSEGYSRLKKRELAMGRSFEDQDFRNFVLSDQLSTQAQVLAQTLERWRHADSKRAAQLALAYLPKGAHIGAKIYPVIKPRQNSFVFDLDTDPAIFLYLDPVVNQAKFENTLAHELHHIGFGTICPAKETKEEFKRLPKNLQTVLTYTGAFGEGFAMLAAAGGPNIHPHSVSAQKDRTRWDRDVTNFDSNLRQVETFFLDVLAKRVSDDQIGERVAPFYGEQGAWYTVGWKMAVLIENTFGRRTLIKTMCDPRKLLETYNRAAEIHNRKSREKLVLWGPPLIGAVR